MAIMVCRFMRPERVPKPRARRGRGKTQQKRVGETPGNRWTGPDAVVEPPTPATAIVAEEVREPQAPEDSDPGGSHEQGRSRYEISVPMRGMDEWALWSYLEKMFGDDANFSVVVSA